MHDPSLATFAFHRLDVYQVARQLVTECRDITTCIPRGHRKLADQLLRASTSTKLNISEGAVRRSRNDKAHRYQIAQAECGETFAVIETLVDLDLVSFDLAMPAMESASRVSRMLQRLIARFR